MGGIWTGAGVPQDRILTVQRAVAAAMRTPLLERLMRESDSDGPGSTPGEFAERIAKELAMQRNIARRIGMGRQ
jgi:tripartite-type tricarboxylate transporter receptor subunit TctC